MATEIICKRAKHWLTTDVRAAGHMVNVWRYLTSGEVSTALRPFYFTVHPDLFGQYPSERKVNENSLQILSSFLESLQQNRPQKPTTVKFFLRPQGFITDRASLKSVSIQLSQRDVRKTVVTILSSCNLPTTYVDSLKSESKSYMSSPLQDFHVRVSNFTNRTYYEYDYDYTNNPRIKRQERKRLVKEDQSLKEWLQMNIADIREKLAAMQPVRDEVVKLQETLCSSLGLQSVLWDCGWNISHFRGCLISFQALAQQHSPQMAVLKGRTLVFGNNTGVSLDGHVLLNSGEVRNNWLDFIKNVHKDDAVLLTVPAFERAVSRVLRDIRVVRRKFQPKTMAIQYETNLRRLTTSLSDHQGRKGYPRHWPDSLDYYELVVETEAGPLMVSPTGQFIVPASCPSFLLVNFLSENLQNAANLLHHYRTHKHIEKELHKQCVNELQLASLFKDDSISPDLMTNFLKRILLNKDYLITELKGTRIWVTNYYSTMSDGQICIPWNFIL